MTLINCVTRVHFADGVLEEALRSEMELHAKRRPLIIAEEGHLTAAVAERFFSSFPIRTRAETFSAVPHHPTENAAGMIARAYKTFDSDLLIAFGSNRAMDLAKIARIAIAFDEPIAALSTEEGGAQRISAEMPDLYAIPGILGFASAITDYTRVRLDAGGQALFSSQHLIPSVTICDPTLTLGASPQESAIAAAGILARAVNAYLAPGYNPPADAMALDSLSRVAQSVHHVVFADDLGARREMMAAGLNSALALQKGLCAVHAICNAVASVADHAIDPSVLGGVLIPELSHAYLGQTFGRTEPVRRALNLSDNQPLHDGLANLVASLPLATTLNELGISRSDLPRAAELAMRDRAISNGTAHLDREHVLRILHSVHGAKLSAAAQAPGSAPSARKQAGST
ncbi:MAG: iron-containing alcohol dehydrogenase [Paracoccaceae bacterium]